MMVFHCSLRGANTWFILCYGLSGSADCLGLDDKCWGIQISMTENIILGLMYRKHIWH